MSLCRNNHDNKKQFLNALTYMIIRYVDALPEREYQFDTDLLEILAEIQLKIIELCQEYQVLESDKILRSLPIKKDQLSTFLIQAHQNFPAAAIILMVYLLHEGENATKLSKKQRNLHQGVFFALIMASIFSSIVWSPIGGLALWVLATVVYFGVKPALKFYRTHQILKSLYADLPDRYKDIINVDLARRNIEVFPTDKVKDVLEKATDYKKYQDKRAKEVSKGLSWYGLFAHQNGPKQIILEYAIGMEESVAEMKGVPLVV